MPYLRLNRDDDDPNAPRRLQSAGLSSGGAPAPGPAGGAGPTSVPGGGFTNLADYVRANQSQAKGMADKVINSVEATAAKAAPPQNKVNPSMPSQPQAQMGLGPQAPRDSAPKAGPMFAQAL